MAPFLFRFIRRAQPVAFFIERWVRKAYRGHRVSHRVPYVLDRDQHALDMVVIKSEGAAKSYLCRERAEWSIMTFKPAILGAVSGIVQPSTQTIFQRALDERSSHYRRPSVAFVVYVREVLIKLFIGRKLASDILQ